MSNKLVFYFQPSFSGWMPTSIYEELFKYYKSKYGDLVAVDNTSILYNNNYGHRSGPHHMIIENVDTKLYKVVTYWDRAYELMNDDCDWNNSKCLGIYSAVDAKTYQQIHKTSYCVHNTMIEDSINIVNTDFTKKNRNSLFFRGFLYSDRHSIGSAISSDMNFIKVSQDRISYSEYIQELNSYQIGLSLNGAAEICNRDMEILGVGSVLLRPKLINTDFLNPLVPEFHYVSFETSSDPKAQLEILREKHNILIKDRDYMMYVALNGKEWYNENGSRQGNVSVLTKVLNIEELL